MNNINVLTHTHRTLESRLPRSYHEDELVCYHVMSHAYHMLLIKKMALLKSKVKSFLSGFQVSL